MISPDHIRAMADYNRWQNQSITTAAASLTDQQRKEPRGAFFSSIHNTLDHQLWGDQIWMSRFAGTPKPGAPAVTQSTSSQTDWSDLERERVAFDAVIQDWATGVSADWLAGDLTWYSRVSKEERTRPRCLLVAHLFNHQTHHRGQVHCMLTQAGAEPDDTDLMLLPLG